MIKGGWLMFVLYVHPVDLTASYSADTIPSYVIIENSMCSKYRMNIDIKMMMFGIGDRSCVLWTVLHHIAAVKIPTPSCWAMQFGRRRRATWALSLFLTACACTFVPPPATNSHTHFAQEPSHPSRFPAPAAIAAAPLWLSLPAHADDLAGAAVAYGHYLALVLATACLVAERLMVKPGMSAEEEQRMQYADILYDVAGIIFFITGYLRTTEYGKGWDFYQHEPIFWIKVILAGIMAASSFFVTTTLLKRSMARSSEAVEPLSEKLATRMTSVINAQLLAVGSIPLAATLMARGVGYLDWLPWQAGAAPAILAFGGLGFKYVKEAVDWKEETSG